MKTNYSLRKSLMLAIVAIGFSYFQMNAQTVVNGIAYNIINDGAAVEVAPLPSGERYSEASMTVPASVEINGTTYPVKRIGNDSMRENPNLISVVIPEGVESIGDGAFAQCPIITEIVLPSSVKSLEPWAFYGCPKLNKINIPAGVPMLPHHIFAETDLRTMELPSSVTELEYCAFQNARNLASINLENIRKIGGWSLYGTAISSATITNVFQIDREAFRLCPNLEKVVLNSVVSIGIWAFTDCTSLSYVDLGTIETIDEGAFSGCTRLTSLTIPNTVILIQNWSLEKSGLKEIFISWADPVNEVAIEESAFGADEGKIDFTWKVPEDLSDVYGGQFMGYPVEIGEPPVGIATEQINATNVYYVNGSLNLTDMEGYTVSVISLDGRTIASFQVNGANVQLPVSLNSGIYLLNANNGNNRSAVKFAVN